MNALIGERGAPSFDDPLGMLLACHQRIERQLDTLERLARHLPEHGADADARTAARAILRYFDTAAPHHHADEEASIFPRLIARAPAAAELLARLGREHHEVFEAHWRRLRPLLAAIASGTRESLPPGLVNEVRAAYHAHIAAENTELIPLCADTLTPSELEAIGIEMAARRGTAWRPAQKKSAM